MLAYISGTILSTLPGKLVVVLSGVGFEVRVSPQFGFDLAPGASVSLHTRMIVREDEITLYGFSTPSERELFDLLCSVTGVGPKMALGAIGFLGNEALRQAMATGCETTLVSVPGIGVKTAKLILLTIGSKVSLAVGDSVSGDAAEPDDATSSVQTALIGLGLSETEARRLVEKAVAGSGKSLSASDLLRLVLQLRQS